MVKKRKTKKIRWSAWRKLAIVFLLFLVLPFFVRADSLIPNMQNGTWQRSISTPGNDSLIGLNYSLRTLLWTAGVILESSQNVLTRVTDINFYNQLSGFSNKPETGRVSQESGYNIIRQICNTILVIILLFIALGTILRVESYNYKYLLVKLVVAAILINFSGMIAGIVLDFSHVIMSMGRFTENIQEIGTKIQENSQIMKEYTNNIDLGDFSSDTSGNLIENMTRTISRFNVNMILASIMMLILGITVLAVSLFLVIRTVSLWFLFTLAPLAFAFYVLPNTRVMSLKWWDAFLRYAFTGPLLFFLLFLTVVISKNLEIEPEPAVVGTDKFIFFSDSGSLLSYLFMVVLLWASVFLSRSLSIAGATQVVGYFKDITGGGKSIQVISKLVDSGGSAISRTGAGQKLSQMLSSPSMSLPAKDIASVSLVGTKAGIKAQAEATRKALESLLNPSALGRAFSIADSKRKGGFAGDLAGIGQTVALSRQDPAEYLRKAWRRFEPQGKATGNFWQDAKTLNEEVNKQVVAQEKVRQVFNEMGTKTDKINQFQAQDVNAKEAQIYKMAWTGGLPDYFNQQGKAYNPGALADHLKTTFGEKRGGQIAEKLKMIGETKKDASLNVASWNEKKSKFEISEKPKEAAKIDPKDLRTIAPQSILNKDNKGNYTGFNETGMQLIKNMSQEYLKEIKNMREDTVQAMTQAYKSSQEGLTKELSKQIGKAGGGIGQISTESIQAISQAQMKGKFNVQEVQAPHAQISLGQEFLNKVAGRAFASKQMKTGQAGVISADESREKAMEKNLSSVEAKREQSKIVGREFAKRNILKDKNKMNIAVTEDEAVAAEEIVGLKDKQKMLMLGGKAV